MSDLRVSASLGLTIPLPGDRYSNVRPEIVISGLDPEGDVEAQIQLALATGEKAWLAIDGSTNFILSKLLSPNAGIPTPIERLEAVERSSETNKRNINTVTEKVKELIPSLSAAVKATGAGKVKVKVGEAEAAGS